MLTKQDFIDAYATTGLKPVVDSFYDVEEPLDSNTPVECACGLGALAIARGCQKDYDTIKDFCESQFGKDFVDSFTSGFDNVDPTVHEIAHKTKIDAAVYALGQEVRAAVNPIGVNYFDDFNDEDEVSHAI